MISTGRALSEQDGEKKWSDFYYRIVVALRPIAVFHFSILVILFIVAAIWADRALKLPTILSARYAILFSLPFYGVGLFLILWSGLHFVKAKDTLVPWVGPLGWFKNLRSCRVDKHNHNSLQ